jgi:hypothetical protein
MWYIRGLLRHREIVCVCVTACTIHNTATFLTTYRHFNCLVHFAFCVLLSRTERLSLTMYVLGFIKF